jgi:hypothetical protein
LPTANVVPVGTSNTVASLLPGTTYALALPGAAGTAPTLLPFAVPVGLHAPAGTAVPVTIGGANNWLGANGQLLAVTLYHGPAGTVAVQYKGQEHRWFANAYLAAKACVTVVPVGATVVAPS